MGGTLAVIVESSTTVKLPAATATAPKRTALAPVRVVPAMVTAVVVTTPSSGVRLVILGSALNAVALLPLPAGLVTPRIPVSAPAGTTTCSDVAVTAVGTAVAPPANVTSEEPVRPMPPIVIVVPTVAAAGVSVVTLGTESTVSLIEAVLVVPWPSFTTTLRTHVWVAPVALAAAVQVGVFSVGLLNVPLRMPVHVEVHAKVSVWPKLSTASTLRLTTPPGTTGFGVPSGPAVIVSVWSAASAASARMRPKPVLTSKPAAPMFSAVFSRVLRRVSGSSVGTACTISAATPAAWGAAAEVPKKFGKPSNSGSLPAEKNVVLAPSGATISGLNWPRVGRHQPVARRIEEDGGRPARRERLERGRGLVVGRADRDRAERVGVAVDRPAVESPA